MMKNKILIILLFLPFIMKAQNDVAYTHFIFNKMAYNPAYTGNQKTFELLALYRKQWSGINGAPTTGTFAAQLPFFNNKNAVGLALTSDAIGQMEVLSLDLSYAYHIRTGNTTRLSLGLMGRLEQARIDWNQSQAIDIEDSGIPSGQETVTSPNFGFGAYYSGDNFYVGLSSPRLLKNTIYLDQSDKVVSKRDVTTWYVMAGTRFSLSSNVEFAPSILASYNPNAPLDLDLNANFFFMQSIWAGLSYRWDDSLDALIGYEFKNGIRVGFAYDFTLSELEKATNGSYEVMLGYTFKCKDCEVPHLRYF